MPTIAEALNHAATLHRAGELDQAEGIYRQVLAVDQRNADAWHLLGLVAHARGAHPAAAEYIGRAIMCDGAQPSFHHHLAEVHLTAGQLKLAEQSCRQALRLNPQAATACNTLGAILNQQGRQVDAAANFERAIQIDPTFALAHSNLGATLHALGRSAEGIAACRRALTIDPGQCSAELELSKILREAGELDEALAAANRAIVIDPNSAEAEFQLGLLEQGRGATDEAIAHYQRTVSLEPRHAPAWCNLGTLLKQRKQLREAFTAFQHAVQAEPTLAEAHFNLGVLLQYQGKMAAARDAYQCAIAVRPEYAEALNNLGAVLAHSGDWTRAAECYSRSLELLPDEPETLNNLGNLLKVQGRLTEAAICYERTLKLAPDYPQVRYNWGLMLLAHGNFAEGWPHYEWRLRAMDAERKFDQPRWQGEPLRDKTIVVHAEQGFGDTIQFVRYLPLVRERVGRVICEVQPALVPLMRQSRLASVASFMPRGEPLPQFDVQISLLSLPAEFQTTAETVPLAEGYLAADPERVANWETILGATNRLRIGVAWQGSAGYPGDRERSIPLAEFAPLALPEVELISLQKGFGSEQLAELGGRFVVRELGPDFDAAGGAFMDAAAVIQNLDLVVTSDTAIAHLAGALGKPTWLATSLVPDWRWMLDRSDSPWYASITLFRQSRLRDWSDVFQRMAAELSRRFQKP